MGGLFRACGSKKGFFFLENEKQQNYKSNNQHDVYAVKMVACIEKLKIYNLNDLKCSKCR